MKRCNAMVDASRRKFLAGAGFAAAAASTVLTTAAKAAPAAARVDYLSNRLANVNDLKIDEPMRAHEFDAIGEDMEKQEKQKFGGAGFEKMAAYVADLERKMGIADLNQFTPSG